jgi:outer membrane protein TolC
MAPGLALTIACVGWSPANAQSMPPDSGLTLRAVIERTLELDPQITRARWALEESRGSLMRAQGAFDFTLATSAVRQDAGSAPKSASDPGNVTQYNLRLGQRLRGGIVVTPQLTVQRSQFAASEVTSEYHAADMGMALIIPLMRGRGGGLLTAAEEAALMDRQARGTVLEHQRAVSVLIAVQAYWSYVTASRRSEVLRDAESRALRLLDETQKLIEADERPAADEIRVRANYASKRANRLAAESRLTEARGTLASAIGVSQELLLTLPPPATPLPDVTEGAAFPSSSAASELALACRRDLIAAHNQAEAAAALLSGVQSESRPRFDLSLGVDYGGAATGSPLNAFNAAHGVRTTLGFSFELPFQNRDAVGLELQQQARLQQAQIERSELARQISIEAVTAANRLQAAEAQLRLAHEAAQLFAQDVQSEIARFRLGVSTLFDLFFSQDALTGAALAELDAQLGYAIALARLRFETATLFKDASETAAVDVDALFSWSTPSPTGGTPQSRPEGERTDAVSAQRTNCS